MRTADSDTAKLNFNLNNYIKSKLSWNIKLTV